MCLSNTPRYSKGERKGKWIILSDITFRKCYAFAYIHTLTILPTSFSQDKKDFIEKRVKRLLKAGVISALAVMVKADNTILTNQTKEMLSRWERKHKQFSAPGTQTVDRVISFCMVTLLKLSWCHCMALSHAFLILLDVFFSPHRDIFSKCIAMRKWKPKNCNIA